MQGISTPVVRAVDRLQRDTFITTKDTDHRQRSPLDAFATERWEHALDEILRQPQKSVISVKSALGNASTVLKERRKRHNMLSLSGSQTEDEDTSLWVDRFCAQDENGYAIVEIRDWLNKTESVTERERGILNQLADGYDSVSLADIYGVPVRIMQQRVSRARRSAKTGYALEVKSA